MPFIEVVFYRSSAGRSPAEGFLEDLAVRKPAALARLRLDLDLLGVEGLRSQSLSIRSLGNGLWELRRQYEGIQYRILFCVTGGRAWILHAFEKKRAKTPLNDLRAALRRMRGIQP